jgi:hypothetical protein
MSEAAKSKSRRDGGERGSPRSGAQSGIGRKRLDLEAAVRERFVDFLDKCRDELDVQRAKEQVNDDIKRVARLMADAKGAGDAGDTNP